MKPQQVFRAYPQDVDAAAKLADCLDTIFGLDRRLTQVGVYASMAFDLDTRVARTQQMQQQSQQDRNRGG